MRPRTIESLVHKRAMPEFACSGSHPRTRLITVDFPEKLKCINSGRISRRSYLLLLIFLAIISFYCLYWHINYNHLYSTLNLQCHFVYDVTDGIPIVSMCLDYIAISVGIALLLRLLQPTY